MLRNLINNSLKHTTQGEIKVAVECPYLENDQIYFKVSIIDQGIGLIDDEIKNIFNAFSQNDYLDKEQKVVGLGLRRSREHCDAKQGCPNDR